MSYNSKNYDDRGGDRNVIGGELAFKAGARVTHEETGQSLLRFQVDSADSTVTGLLAKYNTLLAQLRAVGIMAAEAPTITIPAQTEAALAGADAALNVSAVVSDAGALTYQWYSNATASATGGTEVSGATAASLSIPTSLSAKSYYYCVVTATGTGVSLASDPITVDVPTITIGTQPANATYEAGMSIHVAASADDGVILAYQWYSNSSKSTTGGTAITGATDATFDVPELTETAYYYCVVSVVGTGVSTKSSAVAITVA